MTKQINSGNLKHNSIQDKRTTGYIIAYIEPQGLVHRWLIMMRMMMMMMMGMGIGNGIRMDDEEEMDEDNHDAEYDKDKDYYDIHDDDNGKLG